MNIRCLSCMQEYEDEYDVCPHCGYQRGSLPEETYHLYPETVLHGRYIIGVAIGFGGFGITYKAWDAQLGMVVAIKEYFPTALVKRAANNIDVCLYSEKGSQEFELGLARFLDEAKSTAKFSSHKNIVNVYDYFEEAGTGYIVMEYLDGLSLKEYIKMCGGSVDVENCLEIFTSVISALRALHNENIVHRDVSPDNIFICVPDKVKLIDFGAARISNDIIERTMSIVLKPGYAPPEQYRSNGKQGPWTDVYALGATMYRTLTGIIPTESVNRDVSDELAEPKEYKPDIPDYLNNAIMKAMALQPELRFQSVDEFEEALLSKKKVMTLKKELKKRKQKRIVGIISVLCIILVGLIFGIKKYNDMKFDTTLKETSITIWVPYSKDIQFYNGSIMNARLEDFYKDYPHIKVKIEYIPENEYIFKLSDAIEESSLPDLFISTYIDEKYLENTVKLDDVFKLIDKDDYYLLNDYDEYFPNHKQMPTGLSISIGYINITTKEECASNRLDVFEDERSLFYVSGTGLGAPLSYNEDDMRRFAFNEYNSFFAIQRANYGGKYELLIDEIADDNDSLHACFVETWSVGDNDNMDRAAAAKRVICYLLGSKSEDYLYVQNHYGTPLNKAVFEEYIKFNDEINPIKKYMDDLFVDKDEMFSIEEYCNEKYFELLGR